MRLAACVFILATAAAASARPAPPAKAVTFDDVLAQVKAGSPPADVLANCDVVFTLSPDQQAALARAGAPPALVSALQQKRIAVGDVSDFVVILDCSGSMKDEIGPGQTKMDAAKKVVGDLFRAIPNGRSLAFIVYGHDVGLECKAVKVVRPLGPVTDAARADLAAALARLQPTGHTPIANSLKAAGEVLAGSTGLSQVVVITDGLETCHGDPAAEAEKLTATVKGLRAVEVIGVGLKTADEKAGVAAIARRGLGKFYDADSADELRKAVTKAVDVPVAKPEKPEPKADTSHVRELGETTVDKPAALDFGMTGTATLEQNQSTFVAVKLAAGTQYKVVVDVRQGRATNIQGRVSLLDEDGVEVIKGLIQFNEIDSQFRRVAGFSVKAGGKYVIRVMNANEKAAVYVTVVPVPANPAPAAVPAKYDPAKPGLVPFGGDTLPEPLEPGVAATGRLDAGGTAYYAAVLPKGEYKVLAELTNAEGRSTNVQGYLALLDGDGGGQQKLVTFNEIDVTSRKGGGFTLKEPGVVILRVKIDNVPMRYTLKVRPAAE